MWAASVQIIDGLINSPRGREAVPGSLRPEEEVGVGLTQSDGLRRAGNAKLGEMEKSDSTNFGSRLGHPRAGGRSSPLGVDCPQCVAAKQ